MIAATFRRDIRASFRRLDRAQRRVLLRVYGHDLRALADAAHALTLNRFFVLSRADRAAS